MFQKLKTIGLSIALIGLLLTVTATAQVVPHKGRGTGFYSPVTGVFGGTGVATHLGQNTFAGQVAIAPTANPLVFDFAIDEDNPQETTGANGDMIYFSGSGQVELFPLDPTFTVFSAVWSGDYVVEGGTGRFANVLPGPQPLDVVAINDPFTLADPVWTFAWRLNGFIDLNLK